MQLLFGIHYTSAGTVFKWLAQVNNEVWFLQITPLFSIPCFVPKSFIPSTVNDAGSCGEKTVCSHTWATPLIAIFETFFCILGYYTQQILKDHPSHHSVFSPKFQEYPWKHVNTTDLIKIFILKKYSGTSNKTFSLLAYQNMLNHLAYSSHEASVINQENCSFQLVQSSAKA